MTMLPNDGPHNDPVMLVTPDGETIHVPRSEYDRLRQEPDQPSPTHSDGELRNMVNPDTGQDVGGNPLQEGVWAGTDGGWQPDYKRDESFASVKSYKIAGTVVVPGPGGIHNGPLGLLSKLKSISIDGVHVSPENHGHLFGNYALPGEGKFGHPVQVSAHHPGFEQLAARIIQDGHGNPGAYKDDVMGLQAQIKAGQIPPPTAPAESLQPTASLVREALFYPFDQYKSPAFHGTPESELADHYINAEQVYRQHGLDAAHQALSPALRDRDDQRAEYGHEPMHDLMLKDFEHELHKNVGGDAQNMFQAPPTNTAEPINQAAPQGHQLNWTPGMRGRAIMIGNHLHSWNTLDPNDPEAKQIGPLHSEYVRDHGGVDPRAVDYTTGVEIHPDGSVESPAGHDVSHHIQHDPRLHPHAGDDMFNFSSVHFEPELDNSVFLEPILATHIEMPWGYEDEVLDRREASVKVAGPAAALLPVAGVALRAAAPALMRGALAGGASQAVKGLVNGGGAPAQAQPDGGAQQPTDASFYSSLGDLSNPSLSESKDGDTKQFDADSTSTNPDNPNKGDGQGGADTGEDDTKSGPGLFGEGSEGIKRLEMILPLILHYHNSDEAGEHDPIVRSLHELLDQESPGYLDNDPDDGSSLQQLLDSIKSPPKVDAHKSAVPMPATNQVQAPVPQGGLQQPMQQGQPAGAQGTCPNCGGVLVADGSCPQCGAKANPMGAAIPGQMAPGAPGMPPNAMGQQVARVAADHQGPVMKEQQQAVSQLLLENGRQNEIPQMIAEPWNYAEELAQVAQRLNTPPNVDPNEAESQPPVAPAQEAAPPGATMPVPNPADPSQQAAAPQMMASRQAADNVAPKCPNCGSHTTALDTEDGDCHCHACGHTFPASGQSVVETTASRIALVPDHPLAITDADQHAQHDVSREQDTSHTWKDNANKPLSVGTTYQMSSEQYNIPDIVKVVAVKPDSIVVQTVGMYGNDGGDMPYTHEVSSQEAQMDGLQFVPQGGDDPANVDPSQADPAPATTVNTEPQSAPDVTSRPSPVASTRDWLMDDADDFGDAVTSNYEKTAGKKYTPMEQREFIEERGVARNSDLLDLKGTHYKDSGAHDLNDEFALWL